MFFNVKACSPELKAEVAAVVMEPGLAHVCLITDQMTLVKARIQKKVPKNKYGKQDKATVRACFVCVSIFSFLDADLEDLSGASNTLFRPSFLMQFIMHCMSEFPWTESSA